jgi:RNA 2',3'-cyclic 3'-phosphodiesterase
VSLPVEVRAWALAVVESLRESHPQARWVESDNLHITLKFLGWVDAVHLETIRERTASVAKAHRSAAIAGGAVGAFPRSSRARVIWLGLEDPDGLLGSIAGALDGAFEDLGVARENRSFTPHLTLARFRTPSAVGPAAGLPPPPAPFRVDHIDLYRSHLSPKGARYEKLASEYLGAS